MNEAYSRDPPSRAIVAELSSSPESRDSTQSPPVVLTIGSFLSDPSEGLSALAQTLGISTFVRHGMDQRVNVSEKCPYVSHATTGQPPSAIINRPSRPPAPPAGDELRQTRTLPRHKVVLRPPRRREWTRPVFRALAVAAILHPVCESVNALIPHCPGRRIDDC